MQARLLVLLGPPGSGKSWLGTALAQRLGLAYVEHEALLVSRWVSRAAFVASKAAALREVEDSLRLRLQADPVVVFETTGLSDRPMLERLGADHATWIVRVDAPRDLCVERVRQREAGRHFDDDPEAAGRFHDHWTREVAPRWACDLAVVNDGAPASTEAIVEAVRALLSGSARGAAG